MGTVPSGLFSPVLIKQLRPCEPFIVENNNWHLWSTDLVPRTVQVS